MSASNLMNHWWRNYLIVYQLVHTSKFQELTLYKIISYIFFIDIIYRRASIMPIIISPPLSKQIVVPMSVSMIYILLVVFHTTVSCPWFMHCTLFKFDDHFNSLLLTVLVLFLYLKILKNKKNLTTISIHFDFHLCC